jgi:hypothetical protein
MTRFLLIGIAFPLLCPITHAAPAPKTDQEKAEAILNEAIQAVGGDEKLAKLNAYTLKTRVSIIQLNEKVFTGTSDLSWRFPDQKRFVAELDIAGTKTKITQVINDKQGWVSIQRDGWEMSEKELADAKQNLTSELLVRKLPSYKGKEYKLACLGQAKVADRPAVGIKVSCNGIPDKRLFFDRDSGLLLQCEITCTLFPAPPALPRRGSAALPPKQPYDVTVRALYEDYKGLGGIKYPSKITGFRDGEKVIEQEVTEFKPVEKFEESIFGKPRPGE